MQKKILVVDDHVLIRASLVGILQKMYHDPIVYEASDSSEALIFANITNLDIVLLDIMLPGVNGVLLLPKLKRILPSAEYIVITAKDIEKDHTASLLEEAGVSGIISKSSSIETIRDSLVMYLIKDGNNFKNKLNKDNGIANVQSKSAALASLTRRQLQILELMSRGHSNREICEKIFLAEGTVKNHVSSILNILGVQNRTEAVVVAKSRLSL